MTENKYRQALERILSAVNDQDMSLANRLELVGYLAADALPERKPWEALRESEMLCKMGPYYHELCQYYREHGGCAYPKSDSEPCPFAPTSAPPDDRPADAPA